MSDRDELMDDLCRAHNTFSGERFVAFLLLFVVMIGGGVVAMFADSLYTILISSALGYTASVMLYGFARNKAGIQAFLFTCPVVVSQYPRLLKRHAVFLTVLIAIVTIALHIKPHLSASLTQSSSRNVSPFYVFVAIAVGALAVTEIMMNRGVLERAHDELFGESRGKDDSQNDASLSLIRRD